MLASTKERVAARIRNLCAVNYEHVVMQTRNKRCCSDCPEPVSLFFHIHFGPTPEVQADLSGVGSFNTKLNSTAAVNARILCAPNVCSSGFEITWLLCKTHS